MNDNSSKEYYNIRITGPISVPPVVPGNLPRGVPIVSVYHSISKLFAPLIKHLVFWGQQGQERVRYVIQRISNDIHLNRAKFIEALSENPPLRISSNQLEGFTQSIGTYKLENVTVTSEDRETSVVYLIDVPGFADTKFSETSIILMLREWMKVSP